MPNKDYSKDKELFYKALEEAIVSEFDETLEDCEFDAQCSKRHYRRMSKILGYNVLNPSAKIIPIKKIVIIGIAALLVLGGCVFHKQIFNFIENVYETYIKVEVDNGDKSDDDQIESVYKLTYIPEGYTLTKETITPVMVVYEWKKSESKSIIFRQNIQSGSYLIDYEENNALIFEYNSLKVYCQKSSHSFNYIWHDDKYSFSITSNDELMSNELTKILNGMISE